MIRTSPANHYRAAALVAAAVLSFNLHRASAQLQDVDLFGGSAGTTPTLILGGKTQNTTAGTSTAFGPGYFGTLSSTLTVNNTLSEGFAAAGTSNSFTIAQAGLVAAVDNTTATKTFAGSLSPGATYALTLTRTNAFTVGALTSFNISLGAGNTQFVNTTPGTGVLGAGIDLLSLFAQSNVATFQFTVPAGVTAPLTVNINSSEVASVAGGSFTLQSATVTQVPEPGSVVATLLGVGGLMALRFRRRLHVL